MNIIKTNLTTIKINKEYWKNNLEHFRKLFEAIAIACLLLHMFRHLGDMLTIKIKILKGRIKKEYCQDREILGFSENDLKLLQALYYCVANINLHMFRHKVGPKHRFIQCCFNVFFENNIYTFLSTKLVQNTGFCRVFSAQTSQIPHF